ESAGGSIGLGRVARAPADGYTINIGNWSAHVINGAIYTLPYDLKNDFAPIVLLAQAPQIVLSRKAVPADDLKGLIVWLKANPDKATIGTAGVGSPPHIAAVTPHVPVWDKSARTDGKFSRADFVFDRERNVYVCPAGKLLTNNGLIDQGRILPYRASMYDCR